MSDYHSALIVYPPMRRLNTAGKLWPSVFLAGSIEMGKAERWQDEAEDFISGLTGVVYNPRRPDWNSDWKQSIDHPEFNGQVNWELDFIRDSDYVFFVFDPNTQSPITLMELGWALSAKPADNLFVCCPQGFWRKGNVDIICERSGVKVYEDLNSLLEAFAYTVMRRYTKTPKMPNAMNDVVEHYRYHKKKRDENQG